MLQPLDVATRLLELFFLQAFDIALLHADPHPGNYLFMEGARIGLLDFGCSKRFDRKFVSEHKQLFQIPIGDVKRLEHHYRKFRFYNDADPKAGVKREALVRMQKLDISKYHEDRPFDFSDGKHLREVISSLQEMARMGMTTSGFVLYVRAKIGLYNIFHQLGARVNCHRVMKKVL